ncbi:Hypothetical predicted protein [Paramuricea clavata]|uniref:Uncharacterized protein n=1 Tax=Paramuricea clavata TaxID=317549 RepID=A0A6S7GCN2_PARCT|nr:Hypothetical predicted protein [Paramuricea clavata]
MEVQLLYLLLITITTTITNFAGGELLLQMPLTINPVIQEVITKRGTIVKLFSGLHPEFFSRLSPVDMVTSLERSLSHVMRNTVSGAVVLGVAARSDGLTTEQLLYNPHNKWTVNVSITEIRAVLKTDEQHLYPLSDNVTVRKLQELGFRVLQHKYNISLENQAEMLHSSNASTFQAIEQDWINVVKYITVTKTNSLAKNYGVSVETLAEALNLTSSELHSVTLGELDKILLKDFRFLLSTTPATTTNSPTTNSATTNSPTTNSPTTNNPTTSNPTIPTKSPTPRDISLPTSLHIGSETTEKSTQPSPKIVTSAPGKPTEGKREGTTKINLALFVGVAAGLLLLLVASSSVWCLRRKRRNCSQNEKNNSKDGVKMNNIWLDKTENPVPPSPEERHQAEQLRFVRSASTSTLGMDSRFKGLRYSTPRPSSSTFTSTSQVPISRNSFLYDHRKEIFV